MHHLHGVGLKWRVRRNGRRVPYWVASEVAIKGGFLPKTVRLNGSDTIEAIKHRCGQLQAEMVSWLKRKRHPEAGARSRPRSGRTFGQVIQDYLDDPES